MRAGAGTAVAPLLRSLEIAWTRSDALFGMLVPEALYARPIALRHPFVFYLGHLAAFAFNQVVRGVLGRPPGHPRFDELFERGIDPVGVDAYPDAESWPEPADVLAYRDRCRNTLREVAPAVEARADEDVLAEHGRIYSLVLEHELMHQETLLYMFQQLGYTQKRRPHDWPAARLSAEPSASERIEIAPGVATLGAAFDAVGFGCDNEFPEHRVEVPPFRIASHPVRNDEFAEFVESGGYDARGLWDEEGWIWKERSGVHAPAFWSGAPGRWRYRGLFEEWPLERVAAWPVSVSWVEARAFARWRDARLPTEAELHRAAFATPEGGEQTSPWGDAAPANGHGNFGFRQGGPVSVAASPRGASAWGVHDLIGNGWEWTKTVFDGFPGFRAYARTYPGYSKDFFDGRHYVLKGASWATDDRLVRRSFRNWFQPHYPYVFAKFRCVWPGRRS